MGDLGTGFVVRDFVTGSHSTCAVSTENQIKCFGDNGYGQLGLGDTNRRGDSSGEMGDALPTVDLGSQFATGTIRFAGNGQPRHYSAYKEDLESSLKCWGYNGSGQLGIE